MKPIITDTTTNNEPVRYVALTQIQWMRVAMLEPFFQENGRNATRVYYDDGSYDQAAATCDLILKWLAYYHHTSLEHAKQLAKQCVLNDRKRKHALWLSETCSLIPIKCRNVYRNKSSLGYVVIQHLWSYSQLENGNTLIRFFSDHEGVEVLQKKETVKVLEDNAREIHACYQLKALQHQQLAEQAKKENRQYIGHYRDTNKR